MLQNSSSRTRKHRGLNICILLWPLTWRFACRLDVLPPDAATFSRHSSYAKSWVKPALTFQPVHQHKAKKLSLFAVLKIQRPALSWSAAGPVKYFHKAKLKPSAASVFSRLPLTPQSVHVLNWEHEWVIHRTFKKTSTMKTAESVSCPWRCKVVVIPLKTASNSTNRKLQHDHSVEAFYFENCLYQLISKWEI